MFTGIKDKLLNTLFVSDEPQPKKKPQFNPQTGAPILQHFQNQWEQIHSANEENALLADQVAANITTIVNKVNCTKTNIDLIGHILNSTNLTNSIEQCVVQVQELYKSCEDVEEKLVQLENVIEEREFDRMVKQHRGHLESYRAKKEENLRAVHRELEQKYKEKLLEQESSKKTLLEERQKVFQEAFKSDLEMYKSLGTIPKVELPKSQNGAILEEIQLDYDQNELENFFNDDK